MKLCSMIHVVSLHFVFVFCMTCSISSARGQSLEPFFREAASDGEFVMPSQRELAEAQRLFELLLAGQKDTAAFADALESLHMEMLPVRLGGNELTIIREKSDRKTGRGFYIHCSAASAPVYLMAPHSFTDVLTGRIALKLAEQGGFLLTALNTGKRYVFEKEVRLNRDLAHLNGTYFTALSQAIAGQTDSPRVVQLHGFARRNRTTSEGRKADIIVSSGQLDLLPAAKRVADRLADDMQFSTCTYPDGVGELGARTNVTGRVLRDAGQGGFIHVELSRPARIRLDRDEKVLRLFNGCLAGCR